MVRPIQQLNDRIEGREEEEEGGGAPFFSRFNIMAVELVDLEYKFLLLARAT